MEATQNTARDPAVQPAAERLRPADSVHRACDPVGDQIGDDLAAAYAVQRLVTELQVIGVPHACGRKVLDLTEIHGGPSVIADRPVDTMVVRDAARVAGRIPRQPRVAVRVAVRLMRGVGGASAQRVRHAICAVGAFLEIADPW